MTDVHAPWEYDGIFSSHDIPLKCALLDSQTGFAGGGEPADLLPSHHPRAMPATYQQQFNNTQQQHQQHHQPHAYIHQLHQPIAHPHPHGVPLESHLHGGWTPDSHTSSGMSDTQSSHCSSPFEVAEPVWLDEDLVVGDSESESTSTTPQQHGESFHTEFYQHTILASAMPTIAEQARVVKPEFEVDGLRLSPPNSSTNLVGMLLPTAALDVEDAIHTAPVAVPMSTTHSHSSTSSNASTSSDQIISPVVGRSKRRTRVGAKPSTPPTIEREDSRNLDVTSTGSAQSSEQDDEEITKNGFDEEYDEDVSPGKNSKRKRASGGAKGRGSSAASAAALDDDDMPASMKGLDKRERNKLSASMYRKRRKVYLDSLEGKVSELDATIAKQSETISRQQHENKVLKEQLSFMKKMLAGLKNPLGGGSVDDAPQASNLHHGARRSVGQSAGAFLFLVLMCCLVVNPSWMGESGSDIGVATGRRGRTLLSIDEAHIELHGDAHSAAHGLGPLPTLDDVRTIKYQSSFTEKVLEFDMIGSFQLALDGVASIAIFLYSFVLSTVAAVCSYVLSGLTGDSSIVTGGGGPTHVPAPN